MEQNTTENIYIHSIYIVNRYNNHKGRSILWLSYAYVVGILW